MAVAAFLAQKACAACVALPRPPQKRLLLSQHVKGSTLKRMQTRTLKRVWTWMGKNRNELRDMVAEEVADPFLTWAGSHPLTVLVYLTLLLCYLLW